MTNIEPAVVALAADDAFSRPLAVTVQSLLRQWNPDRAMELYLFDMGISEPNRAIVEGLASKPFVTLHWITSVADRVSGLPQVWTAITRATYARLYIPGVLPADVQKVLYLDTDIVVRRSLDALYDLPVGANAVLGVADAASPFVSSPYGVPHWFRDGRRADDVNVNAGILLMNLEVWRDEGIAEQALTYLTDGRHYFTQDQEAINAVLRGRIGEMDLRWNQQTEIFDLQFRTAFPADDEALERLLGDPWVIHYTTPSKPWLFGSTHPFAAAWFEVLDDTPYRGWRPSKAAYVKTRAATVAGRFGAELKKIRSRR